MISEDDLGWDDSVLRVLAGHYREEVSLGVIYFEVSKYRKLSEWDYENIGYDEPRYQQIVRSIDGSLALSPSAQPSLHSFHP